MDEIQNLDNKIEELEKIFYSTGDEIRELKDRRRNIFVKNYLSEKILNTCLWKMGANTDMGRIHLINNDYRKTSKNIYDIFENEYHDSVYLNNDVHLVLDDGDIYIYSDDNQNLLNFIKEQEINFIKMDLSKEIKDLRDKIEKYNIALNELEKSNNIK
jgi:hypothetical protein